MRMNCRRLLPLLAVLVAASVGGTAIAQITSVPPATYLPPPLPKSAAVERLLPVDAPRRVVVLPAPDSNERASLKAVNATPAAAGKLGPGAVTGKGRPLAIGYGRLVPAADRTIYGSKLTWQALADGGSAARIEISSEGAAAVRVGLAMAEHDPDITLRFAGSAPNAAVFGPYPANRIAEVSRSEGVFWSPVLEGATATIEVYVPAGVSPKTLHLTLARISHLAVAGAALRNIDPKRTGIGASDSCEVDVVCITPPTAALTNAAKSVAKIVFTQEDGISYACTGTLLNDSQASFTPYFLTANHCINSQSTATTMNSYWFFDAGTCGSLDNPPYILLTDGAMLLGRSDDWDWALVRLKSPPPAGSMFAAWRAEALSQPVASSTLHHPQGDLKKWSQGGTFGFREFNDGSSFIQMRYTRGSTEGGSSGSGLLTYFDPGGYYEVRGGLFGGDASCSNISGSDYFSRLDNALPLLRQYLTPGAASPTGAVAAVEFYHAVFDDYFITFDPDEILKLDTGVLTGWVRTGLRFLVYPDAASAPAGASPVCRFYVLPNFGNSHWFSAIPSACAETAQKFPTEWFYEKPDFFYMLLPNPSDGSCPANSHPIFAFVNDANGFHHRFTAEVDLRNSLIDLGGWTQEGYGNPARGSFFPGDKGQVVMCSPNS